MVRRAKRIHEPSDDEIGVAISQSVHRIELIPDTMKALLNQVCVNMIFSIAKKEIDHTTALMSVCRTGFLLGVLAKEKNWKTEII